MRSFMVWSSNGFRSFLLYKVCFCCPWDSYEIKEKRFNVFQGTLLYQPKYDWTMLLFIHSWNPFLLSTLKTFLRRFGRIQPEQGSANNRMKLWRQDFWFLYNYQRNISSPTFFVLQFDCPLSENSILECVPLTNEPRAFCFADGMNHIVSRARIITSKIENLQSLHLY